MTASATTRFTFGHSASSFVLVACGCSRFRDQRGPVEHGPRSHSPRCSCRCLVWHLSRSHYCGRIFAGHPRGKRLGLLLRQPVLLGETWRLRRGGSVINHAHSGVHSLAKGDIGQSHLRPGSAWNPQCQARPVRGSNSLCAHSCIRRGHGSELRFAVALAPI